MTADPTTALSCIDVLDDADHTRLDGWGNRAVLTAPPAGADLDPGGVRHPGGRHPGRGRADLRARCA